MKNYVMSDDTSLDEALAAARNDDEREQTAQQLDAFHTTFNFCMNCRQYTCANCWNEVDGQCLTCSPHLGHEIMPAPFSDIAPLTPAESLSFEASAWPSMDLPAEPEPETVAATSEVDEAEEIDVSDRLARLSEWAPRLAESSVEEAPSAAEADDAAEPAEAFPDEAAQVEAKPVEAAAAAEVLSAEPVEAEPVEIAAVDAEPVAVEAAEVAPIAELPEVAAASPAEPVVSEASAPEEPVPDAGVVPPAASDVDELAAAASRQTASLLAKF
ncbi:MAG TPA: hypothetical protein VGQ64_12455, partial [Candidatus Limnocylindrales bacterium]|nr:hypothetical protein [Candidatus Limnocylindrales bacterium]